MYAVGRLGSYITRGVYTVSGPFHPFGGAVDIVVVEQQDGSYKSSPWYVRFGKFQGVLKGNEKVIDISVNDVEADFHMYLDQRGEAYFLREVEPGEVDTGVAPPSSSGEEMGSKKNPNRTMPVKSMSLNYGLDQCDAVTRIDACNAKSLSRTNSRRSRILGFVLGRKSMKADSTISKQEDDPNVIRADSLERAEIAADLLDLNWSTNKRRGEGNVRKTFNSASDILDAEVSKGWQINDGQVQVESLLNEQYFANNMENSMVNDTGLDSKSELGSELLKKIEEIGVANAYHENNADISATTSDKDFDEDGACDEKIGDFTETCASKEETVEGSNEPDMEGDFMETCASKEESVEGSNEPDMETPCLPDEKHNEVSVLAETVHDTPDMNSEVNPQTETSLNYNTVAESYSEVVSVDPVKVSGEVESCCSLAVSNFPTLACKVEYAKNSGKVDEERETQPPSEEVDESDTLACDFVSPEKTPDKVEEEQFFFSDLDDVEHNEVENSESISILKENRRSSSTKSAHAGIESSGSSNYESDSSPSGFDQEVLRADIAEFSGNLRKLTSQVDIPRSCQVIDQEVERHAKSLPIMWSQSDEFDLHNSSNNSLDSKSKSSKWELLRKNVSRIKKSDVRKEYQLNSKSSLTDIHTSNDLKDITHGHSVGDPSNMGDVTSGTWTLWPFRSRSRKSPSMDSKNDSDADCGLEVDGGKEGASIQEDKMKLRALTPTSKQLASLNLKEGRNTVTFTFSTSVLGPQQVDARIYLWRWDTRIVISDVDGTITKSDVLGQFMPLVGRDWSQTGVTHLFSAIKENGYQMLFLSARAISQAYITRQFLFNLKQDGKALPDGPVVISPDGLFPSLFREVIRRAPHEFKIACLEDIKALFPPDRNPFYAGFGNRDTDEFSYVKVGIPKGKIFIINPKGEVVVNRCIDSKSYTSLHALVNGMFPPISLHEEEDYNSWNFWKLPPATLDN